MNYKVIYFTRTDTSRKVAEKIANKLSCEAIEISDNKSWKGILGFIKGGYYASTNKDVDIKIHGNLEGADELIVVTPLWAGGGAPAIRTFLKTTTLEKVHLVVTSKGSEIKNPSGYKSVNSIVRSKGNEETVINNLVSSLI
jgi:flavodoxin